MRAACPINDGRINNDRSSDRLPPEIEELFRAVERLPSALRGRFMPLCRGIIGWSQRQNRLVQAAQEAVNQFQLDIKCLRFDLDMTRRERDAVRRQEGHDDAGLRAE